MTQFITTPLFYASGDPHIGHAYSLIVADTLKRYQNLRHRDTLLITGTDENGQKISDQAERNALPPKDFADKVSRQFQSLWHHLGIYSDAYVRTTRHSHHRFVKACWERLEANDDIYLNRYEGKYCTDCEQFYSDWQLIENDECPIHNRSVNLVSEPSYFFRLEKYRSQLKFLYETNPNIISPNHIRSDLLKSLDSPLPDLSISRTSVQHGIQVPKDENHTVYVWFEALLGYISGLETVSDNRKDTSNLIHVLGKDILHFHAIYWPALLFALDLPAPRKFLVHGWWKVEGRKISKSDPTTKVNPSVLANYLSNDGLRYALLSQKPLEKDGNFSVSSASEKVNSDIAYGLANLSKRYLQLIVKNFDSEINSVTALELDQASQTLILSANNYVSEINSSYDNYNIYGVCNLVSQLVSRLNTYFQKEEPWKHQRGINDSRVVSSLAVTHAIVSTLWELVSPILPNSSIRYFDQLECKKNRREWPRSIKLSDVKVSEICKVFAKIGP